MKKTILLLGVITSLTAIAKNGGDDDTNGRMIICKDVSSNSQILEFSSLQQQGVVETAEFTLSVKTFGDEVTQMILVDKRSEDKVEANRTDEVLTVSFATDESPEAPVAAQSFTNKGFAKIELKASSGDQVEVLSQSRKSVSKMQINLTTDEAPTAGISVICEKSN